MAKPPAGVLGRIAFALLIIAVVAAAGAVLAYLFVLAPFEIDRCLDAGGRWDADRKICET